MMNIDRVFSSGIYISLKVHEYKVIENDVQVFRSNTENVAGNYKFTVNRFMNRVFLSMCSGQKVDTVLNKKSWNKVGINVKINREIADRMKKAGVYFDLAYPADLAAYYKHFISLYCGLSLTEREKIFYGPMIEELNDSIKLNAVLKIRKNNFSPEAVILPYAVKTAEENGFHYIAGFLLKQKDHKYVFSKLICIPLKNVLMYSKEKYFQRVAKIAPEKDIIFKKTSAFQSFSQIEAYMQQRLEADGIIYIGGNTQNVTVKLSDTGFNMLYSRSQFRPKDITFSGENIIRFEATKLQTFLFFFKFGCDAEVLEPQEYRDFFAKSYRKALMHYQDGSQ